VLTRYEVTGLLYCTFEQQIERSQKCVGRGRHGPNRLPQLVERVRYQITTIPRDEDAVAARLNAAGWRAFLLQPGIGTFAQLQRFQKTQLILA
jgi:hypothetical protein